jgi:hypothetical protein
MDYTCWYALVYICVNTVLFISTDDAVVEAYEWVGTIF